MKPRNKYEREVVELAERLQPITERQKQIGLKRLFPFTYAKVCSKTKHHCFECDTDYESTYKGRVEVCPHCGRRNHLVKKKPDYEVYYFALLQRVEQWQVVRYFLYKIDCYRGQIWRGCCGEMCQMWIHNDGHEVARARAFRPLCGYVRDPWVDDPEMQIRKTEFYSGGYLMDADRYNFKAKSLVVSLQPLLRKYGGYKENEQGPLDTIRLLMKSPHHATLYQTGQLEVFGHVTKYQLDEAHQNIDNLPTVWEMVKICTRHGYITKDYTMWYDTMQMYARANRDMHSPHYLCVPYNELKARHDRIERQHAREERLRRAMWDGEALMKNKKQYEKAQKAYKQLVGKAMLLVEVVKGDIQICPLQTIRDFRDEGNAMHHCVFTNGYYKHSGIVILSARSGDKRLATIELSTSTFKIVQCRGPHNSVPKRDKEIRSMIESNIGKFRMAAAVTTKQAKAV